MDDSIVLRVSAAAESRQQMTPGARLHQQRHVLTDCLCAAVTASGLLSWSMCPLCLDAACCLVL
jgi:hypothetical protein